MESSSSIQQVSLPEKFTKYLETTPTTNENSSSRFNKTELENNPKALAQLICCLCEQGRETKNPYQETPTLFDWARDLYDKQKMPIHHFVKATCWFSSCFPHQLKDFDGKHKDALQNDLAQLLAQYDSQSDKNLERIQKVAKVIQKTLPSLPPFVPTNIVISSGESLPDILLFAESDFYRDNGWDANIWEKAFSKEAIQTAFQFCKTGKLDLPSLSTHKEPASLLWEVMHLAENFEMENLQKMCYVTFFSFFPYLQHLLENVRPEDVTKFTKFLHQQLYPSSPSSRLSADFAFGFQAAIEANATYFIDLHDRIDFTKISQSSQQILLILRTGLTSRLEEGYKDGSLSLSSFFACLLSLPSWAKESKKLFHTVIDKYTRETIGRIPSSCDSNDNSASTLGKELETHAKRIRKRFSELEEFLPIVSINADTDGKTYKISPLLLFAESRGVRHQKISKRGKDEKKEQNDNSWQIEGSPEALNILLQMMEGKEVSFSSFDLVWSVYEVADRHLMPRIINLCQEHILASEELCTDLLTKAQEVSDTNFLRKCTAKAENRFKGLELKLLDDHTWGVILTKWEFAQKECVKKLGEQVTLVAISHTEKWGPKDCQELAEKCPKIRVLFLQKGNLFLQKENAYWSESEIYSFFKTTRDLLSASLPNLKVIYLPKQLQANSLFYVCTKKEYEQYRKNPTTEIPSFDTVFFDEKQPKANLADYPATAKELIDILLHITPSSKISSIDLTNCSHIPASQLENLFYQYSFEEISLEGCSQMTDAILTAIRQKSPQIKRINLSGTTTPDWETMVCNLIKQCHFLEELYLNNCPKTNMQFLKNHRLASKKTKTPSHSKKKGTSTKGKKQRDTINFALEKLEVRNSHFVSIKYLEEILSKKALPSAKQTIWQVSTYPLKITCSPNHKITLTVNKNDQETRDLAIKHRIPVDFHNAEIQPTDSPMRKVDAEGYVHYTIDNPSDDDLIQAWDSLHKNHDWNRLNSVTITDMSDSGVSNNENHTVLHFIEKCTNIKKISIGAVYFDDNVISVLPQACPHLADIAFYLFHYRGKITTITNMLASFPFLTSLSLIGQQTGDRTDDQTIGNIINICPKIRSLDIGCTRVTDSSLEKIAKYYPDLRSLSVSSCKNITDQGIRKFVESNKKLDYLSLTYCRSISHETALFTLQNASFKQLSWYFGEMEEKWYVFAPLKDLPEKRIIEELSSRQSFPQQIRVKGCEQITDNFITFICKNKPKIQALDLRGCHQVTHKGIQQLVTECDSIDSLLFANNANISDETVQSILENCPKFKCLVLEDCDTITDVSLKHIKNYQPRLEHLSLAGCKKISSDGIRSLAKTCKKCEIIDLRNCSQLVGGAINTLVTASKKSITEVRLSGCTLLRDRELESILAVCKQLKVLDIDGCSGISQEMRDSLFTNYPQLQKPPPIQNSSLPINNDNSTSQSDNKKQKKPGKMEENEG